MQHYTFKKYLQINKLENFRPLLECGRNNYYIINDEIAKYFSIASKIVFVSYKMDNNIYFFIIDRSLLDYVKEMRWYNLNKNYIINNKGESLHRYIAATFSSLNGFEVHHSGHSFDHRMKVLVPLTKTNHNSIGNQRQSYGTFTINNSSDLIKLLATL